MDGGWHGWAVCCSLPTLCIFLTTCFDWGPVALQHVLPWPAWRCCEVYLHGKRSTLFWGFFWFGLALWDKALFLWLFSGLLVAAAAVFPRALWSRCTPKNLGLAAAGLLIGALPLVAYNLATDFETFRSNSSFLLSNFPFTGPRAANHLGWRDFVGLYGSTHPGRPVWSVNLTRRWKIFLEPSTRWLASAIAVATKWSRLSG